ncbi:MAG: NAD(P)H-dependent oxidoreductase [Roseibium sp.]|uniref:NAD(P)H-dependent oxidoreductase n=1 Tax=Roseibium sp. TaxID=1936156 RepID=UPI001B2E97CF|nr:NAD(P)H-dependent oxidoreductase [Roseibium sp.]MBO6893675.1 NAD(P)H-dependent oxidoreductase [Roseibium sp.]MBO6928170.1 NAD(P)H-dependent oxidoreductase [Roseibium sp.]
MRILVVYSHPCEESFNAAICKTVVDTLTAAGHEVRLTDLYAEGFDPVLSTEERRAYLLPGKDNAPIADHIADIKWCQAMIFVYPTWWYGQPAMLKGWLERVWVPYGTFDLPTQDHGLQSRMQHISHIGIVTTCGAPWWLNKLVGEPGRKTLLRGIKHLCKRGCKTLYMAHYKMDLSTPQSRKAYLARVEHKVAAFVR